MGAETYQIQQEIYRCENQLSDLEAQQRLLEERLNDLNRLQMRFNDVRSSFESRQQARLNALSGIARLMSTSRAARAYHDGMAALLSGSSYKHVSNGLSDGVVAIQQNVKSTSNELDSVRRQVNAVRNRVERLYEQYRLALAVEMQQG